MHRFKYTKLSKEAIDGKLVPTAAGPICMSEYSDFLSGKTFKIVTDNGPVLSYAFKSKNRLVLAEKGETTVESGYGALTLKHVVFFSHMVPGTQKGFNVVLDLTNDLATVFEVWFSGYKDNREVQRQMYYGYIEIPGKESPTTRHHLTNRIEGKGFHWIQDTGVETLEFYPSIVSSSFVELTRRGDELTYCAPSDFIMINDNMYIYDRVECEFSGVMTIYVMDLFSVTQIGARLGFNEKDALEYYMFRGSGEIVGQLAVLEPFNDHGDKIAFGPNMTPAAKKGERMVYRPLQSFANMTEDEVHQAGLKKTTVFDPDANMAAHSLPFSDFLAGKELTVRYDDGPVWNYRFDDAKKLRWRREGEAQWREEAYRAFEPDDGMIFFCHLRSGTKPAECKKIVLDFANGLTTCVNSRMGTEYMGNEVSYQIAFGVIEMKGVEAPRYVRHALTDELAGRAFSWSYSDQMTSMHAYSTPHSASWTIYMDNQALGAQWSAPCKYVKLRDDVYLFSLVEEACNGGQMTVVINAKIMHDCGFGFSGGKNGLEIGIIGALARNIGCYDVKRFFGPKPRKSVNVDGRLEAKVSRNLK
ncbi:MAG: MoaF N-terminal domain-containing protein [Vicinamibacteria bacterium]|nr:MoaF N-terminal domain-containing protein [Vicinamibacteria bacterium]